MQLTFPIRGQKLSMNVEVAAQLVRRQTPYQTIDVYQTEAFGKVLYLDGHVQLSELDEHAYHECLVHIPLLSTPNPTSALVVGGGDGGVLRELVKHLSLERIDMVEIDQGVVDVCQEFLPEVSDGAFSDPRVRLHIEDAFEFVKRAAGPYDLIVMDSTDVYEDETGGLSEQLWTEPFYRDLHRLLADDGFLVTQADNPVFCPYSLKGILGTFAAVFPDTGDYFALVPSFGGFSAYAWASKGSKLSPTFQGEHLGLRYLNGTTYDLALLPLPFSAPLAKSSNASATETV